MINKKNSLELDIRYYPLSHILMRLMSTKNIYFIPFGQDDPIKKPNSLVARMESLLETVYASIEGKQLQPVLVEKYRDLQ